MANKPNGTTTSEFQPAFKRVAQTNDFDCAFACIAMLTSKTVAEVHQLAISKFKLPPRGPWWLYVNEEMIAGLCAHFGWAATLYKVVNRLEDVSDIAILMVDYDADKDVGRHVLFHRLRDAAGIEYIIDPAYWLQDQPTKQIRMDVKGLPPPLWYIGVQPMKKPGK